MGFCKFEWFPGFRTAPKADGDRDLLLKSDSNGDFIEIFVDEPIPNDVPKELLDLVVEENLETITGEGEVFKIEAGNYSYDSLLGDFGGYKVYLK